MECALFAASALLETGWARDVRIQWDESGIITEVCAGADARAASRAAGPVLPGMTNVHSHAFQRAMAGLAEFRGHETDDFWTWRQAMYGLAAALSPEDVHAIARHLYLELLKHGYTAVAEFHYLHHRPDGTPYADPAELSHRLVEAARESGIALTLLPVLYAYGGFGRRPLEAAQRRFAGTAESIGRLLESLAASRTAGSRLRLGVAPHSARAVDAKALNEVVAALDALDPAGPVHIHVSEQVREVRECESVHGAKPGDWVMDHVRVDGRWCFIHATHLSSKEAARTREQGVVLGLCPTTEANLGDGIFDFEPHFQAGGRFAIGGDSHVCTSPFEELRALECSQRLSHRMRNVASSMDRPDVATNLWMGACMGGAQAAAQPAGRIASGTRADFVILDGSLADFESLTPREALAVAVFSGPANRVRDVYVAGERVVAQGHHAREDEAANAYRAALARLRGRI